MTQPMTLAEKILAAKVGRDVVRPGELLEVPVDWVLAHEITTPVAIRMLEQRGMDRVWNPARVVAVPDHTVPAKDIASARLYQRLKTWVQKHGIEHWYDVGRGGIAHTVFEASGLPAPGEVVVSGDSHTPNAGALGMFATGVGSTDLAGAIYAGTFWLKVPETLRIDLVGQLRPGVYAKDIILEVIRRIGDDGARSMAMEWGGPGMATLSMEERFTLTNMAVEAGGMTGIIAADDVTQAYLREKGTPEERWCIFQPDPDARYAERIEVNLSELEPVVAFPNRPGNGHPIAEAQGIRIDQAYLGSCTNGRISDLRIAASILRGRRVADHVRMIVVPATQAIYKQALREGLLEIFVEAGATVSYPSCGACLGMHTGVLGPDDVCISSTNRNFTGRMGHPSAQIYLASPAVVAASAVAGAITDPREFLTETATQLSA
nr:3-isopropylmalate dehydratase large subunit [Ardenticatena sp.]